jgi:hypothetical protein
MRTGQSLALPLTPFGAESMLKRIQTINRMSAMKAKISAISPIAVLALTIGGPATAQGPQLLPALKMDFAQGGLSKFLAT